ncbi:glycine cleavage system H-protein subunit [Sticta canariensis]|nr:glycine cleavage system H-protein subunit [Sticta canariensis]
MATILKSSLQRRNPITSLLSRSSIFATSAIYVSPRARPGGPHSSKWSARTLTNSAALHEKRYTRDHEWVELSQDGKTGTIGISTYAAKALGDVVFVELPALDTEVSAGDTLGAVESVKSASDILSPLGGKVIAKNDLLEEKPGTINKAPEGEGWIARIEVGDSEVLGMMDGEEYRKFTEE